MALVKVFNLKNEAVGELDLPDSVFKAEVNSNLVHQIVIAQLAGRRRGTAKTKTKSEVRGGGRKPFRQKGTGNARQGSIRSPLMPGGGESHGPVVRSYFQTVPRKMAAGAMRSILSDKFASDRLVVVDDFKFAKPSTKEFAKTIAKFDFNKALFVDGKNPNAELSARNLEKHKFLRTEGVNVYDVINYEWLVLSKKAAVELGERLTLKRASGSARKSAAKE
jgi:large subunit ribosomal protein L4